MKNLYHRFLNGTKQIQWKQGRITFPGLFDFEMNNFLNISSSN